MHSFLFFLFTAQFQITCGPVPNHLQPSSKSPTEFDGPFLETSNSSMELQVTNQTRFPLPPLWIFAFEAADAAMITRSWRQLHREVLKINTYLLHIVSEEHVFQIGRHGILGHIEIHLVKIRHTWGNGEATIRDKPDWLALQWHNNVNSQTLCLSG